MKLTIVLIATLAIATGAMAENFKGYQCTKDCSGHKAGYAWAQHKGVTEKSQCTGKSQSFIEGCWAWAEGR
jgi:hypothetical protein